MSMMKNLCHAGVALAITATLFGCSAMTGRSAGRNVDDASITTSVKTKLATDRVASLTRIDVDTVSGVVYLTGTVSNAAEKQRASAIANEVDGVIRVVNNLRTSSAGDAPERR